MRTLIEIKRDFRGASVPGPRRAPGTVFRCPPDACFCQRESTVLFTVVSRLC